LKANSVSGAPTIVYSCTNVNYAKVSGGAIMELIPGNQNVSIVIGFMNFIQGTLSIRDPGHYIQVQTQEISLTQSRYILYGLNNF